MLADDELDLAVNQDLASSRGEEKELNWNPFFTTTKEKSKILMNRNASLAIATDI